MDGLRDIPSPATLKASGQEEVASLAALLAATKPGESVHGARRRIKQLRSLLRLLRPVLDAAAYEGVNVDLRAAADALAGHRRAEALVAAAGKLEAGEGRSLFWRDVAEANRAAHASESDPAAALAAACEAISHAAKTLAAAPLLPGTQDTVREAFLASYGKARKLVRKGLQSGDPEALHEARKFVIHHLHHLKLLRPDDERRLMDLEQLREVLGDLNDLDELEQLATEADITPKSARRMRKARQHLLGRVRKESARLFRVKPGSLERRLGHAAEPHSPGNLVAIKAGE